MPVTAPDPTTEAASAGRRRHAAGEDPAKRDQILDGARQVFMDQGFDAASMNDICRAAGVSKGTIYVYFEGKEDLYVSLVERERNRMFGEVDALLEQDLPLPEKLFRYGRRLAELLCSDRVVRAQRIIIGTAERMPGLGARFYDGGTEQAQGRLRQLLATEVAAGRLGIPDVALAGHQFIELCTAGLLRPRLFGKAPEPPAPEALDRAARSAVALFLKAYAAPDQGS